MNDPIVDEVRRIRAEHAARFGHDLWAIFRDIKEQQARGGLKSVSFAGKTNEAPEPPNMDVLDQQLTVRAAQSRRGEAGGVLAEQVVTEAKRRSI